MINKVLKIQEGSPDYPRRLEKLPGRPMELYVLGNLPREDIPTVAIVGARMSTPYGRIQAFRFARELSKNGVQVISGLANGIDSEGHKGALEGTTPTFAVMGNGVDICYPSQNRQLYERIWQNGGGIISEYPEGVSPKPYHFPIRNRIISGLADLVLVVEARVKSGSLITANYALEQGKTVYAIPGMVGEALSEGCNKLIFDGAGIAYNIEVILSELGIFNQERKTDCKKKQISLARDMKLVYSCLDFCPKRADDCLEKTNLPIADINRILMELNLMGLIREVGRGYYIRES
ncbi:MAG: DNA-protecting protein DprA [Blautia sp.]|nr:DNA-protecting protein DprA [Blautia sp.]